MPFPLSVSDVCKMFEWVYHRKAENRKAVEEWLESVYADLEDLSQIWFGIRNSLETAIEVDQLMGAFQIVYLRGDLPASAHLQAQFAGRLSEFYRSASQVIGKERFSEFHPQFIDLLGTLLRDRNRARLMLDKELPHVVISGEGARATIFKIREQSIVIQQHVIALQVLIKTFKAQP